MARPIEPCRDCGEPDIVGHECRDHAALRAALVAFVKAGKKASESPWEATDDQGERMIWGPDGDPIAKVAWRGGDECERGNEELFLAARALADHAEALLALLGEETPADADG